MSSNGNHLIDLLGRNERKRLIERCEPFEMTLSAVMGERNACTSHVYFPTEGFASLVIEIEGRPGLEVGMVGREGMLGAELLLSHTAAPWRSVVQEAGAAWRMKASEFQQTLNESTAVRSLVGRYLAFRLEQLTLSAACERFHEISPRLARWLLMSQDRAHSDSIHVTHEFLAFMLGVRREGVTVAASELQRMNLITYRRGKLTVLDRQGLRARACSCYDSNKLVYDRLVHCAASATYKHRVFEDVRYVPQQTDQR
jgi:CRP-like cAMP-binding protein